MGSTNTQSTKKFPPHRAWVVAVGCMLVFGGSSGFFSNCNGVFTAPVPEALGVSRGAFQLYLTIASYVGLASLNFYGELFRRHPGSLRRFMLLGTVVCSGCIFCYSFATRLWHFYAIAVVYGLFMQTLSGLALTTIISNWFVRNKGLAVGMAFTGSSLTAALMMPVLSRVVTNYGWRWGYRLLAVCGFALLTLSITLLIRETPAAVGLAPLGVAQETAGEVQYLGATRAAATRTPAFWLMTLGFLAVNAVVNGIHPHTIAAMLSLGYSPAMAASVGSAVMAVMAAAKLALGALFDRLGAVKSAVVAGGLLLLSVLSMGLAGANPAMPWVFALCFGFGAATITVSLSYFTSANFGPREYAAIYSLATSIGGLGGLSNMLSGWIYDVTGSYGPAWPLYGAVAAVALVSLTAAALLARRGGYQDL